MKLALPIEESEPSFSQLVTQVPTYLSAASTVGGAGVAGVAGAAGVSGAVAVLVVVEVEAAGVGVTTGVSTVLSLPLQATREAEMSMPSKPVIKELGKAIEVD